MTTNYYSIGYHTYNSEASSYIVDVSAKSTKTFNMSEVVHGTKLVDNISSHKSQDGMMEQCQPKILGKKRRN